MIPIEKFCPGNQPSVRLRLGHFNLCKDSKKRHFLVICFQRASGKYISRNKGKKTKKEDIGSKKEESRGFTRAKRRRNIKKHHIKSQDNSSTTAVQTNWATLK